VFPTRYPPVRFIACTTIGHWSSGCYNKGKKKKERQQKERERGSKKKQING